MALQQSEKNAEKQRREGAGEIDKSLTENKLSSCIIDAAIEVPVIYKGETIGEALRLDLLVDNTIIVEVKATEHLHKVHSAQVLTYLRLTQKKLGLVLNFGQPLLRDGICRVVNNF